MANLIPQWLKEHACCGVPNQLCDFEHTCESLCPNATLMCTKTRGHDGPHVACGVGHSYAIWDDGNIMWVDDEHSW